MLLYMFSPRIPITSQLVRLLSKPRTPLNPTHCIIPPTFHFLETQHAPHHSQIMVESAVLGISFSCAGLLFVENQAFLN
jgi:hypothetical protein